MPARYRASESPPGEATKSPVHASPVLGKDHRGPHGDLPRSGCRCFVEGLLPGTCDLDRKGVLRFRGRLDQAGSLVHGLFECVFVDGGCAGVEPDRRRILGAGHSLA